MDARDSEPPETTTNMPDAGESVPESAAREALELDAKLELARDGTKRYVRELPYVEGKY